MFVLATIADTIRIHPSMFIHPVMQSVHLEIEKKFPNRVLMDVGLVICRYGDALEIGDGVCVAGDGGAHHECVFRLVVLRPFVDEVCIGTIIESNEEGIRVSLGNFFGDIHIPAYWMLRPSHFNHESGLWIWTPQYDDDEDDENNNNNEENQPAESNQFEMEIGSEIRFKVKTINFTQVTNTAKGVQATTTTTSHSSGTNMTGPLENAASGNLSSTNNNNTNDANGNNNNAFSSDNIQSKPLRKRSTSVDLSDSNKIPAAMHITASICEDGLGLTSWWTSNIDEEETEEQGEDGYEEGYEEDGE